MTSPARILLIDDNQNFREAFERRLRAEGFEVTPVDSGQEGLHRTAVQSFDLILLDMLMPGKDGITTYQELRANPQTRQTPIILLTCAAIEGHWEPMPYDTDGPSFILGKPYDHQILVERINEVLAKPR